MRPRRRLLLAAPALALIAAGAAGFWAAPPGGGGAGAASSGTLTPAVLAVPAASDGTVAVTWTQQAALDPASAASAGITYAVQRRDGEGAFAPVTSGGCAGALPHGTAGCTDTVAATGPYSYRVVANLATWWVNSAAAGPVTVTITPPVVQSVARADASPTNAGTVRWTVTFSAPVTGVDSGDFALVRSGGVAGGAITAVAGSGATRTVTATTGTGSGSLGLNLVDDDTIVAGATPLGGAGAGNGSLAGEAYAIDRAAPALSALEMRDADANGKVDRVAATFDEPIVASTATAPWSLAGAPSAATVASVSTSGSAATLILAEGADAATTAVGAFQVALAASASGIRDALGNQSAFAATTPADRAGPVPLSLSDTNGLLDGQLANGDSLAVTFSEAIASGAPGSTTITEARANGTNTLAITGITAGALDLGSNNYLGLSGNSIAFAATVASSNAGRTLTVHAGACTSGLVACLLVGAGTGTTMVYIPAPTLLDAAGNAATGSRATGFRIF